MLVFNRNQGKVILTSLMALIFVACGPKDPQVPDQYATVSEQAVIYPDYTDITVPPNIAPLNFMVKNGASSYVVALNGPAGAPLLAQTDEQGAVAFDETKWHTLLEQNAGGELVLQIYGDRNGSWVRYPDIRLAVAEEPIDSFLSYRLIEPGYELYRQVGLYQRNLTNFDERVIYENNRLYDDKNNHCVNCHNYQNYRTDHMLFHVRAAHGGTLIATEKGIDKITIKHDSILSAGVYPTWHPRKNWIVFSTNLTGQLFHIHHREKVEVLDEASDLLFYDADKNCVRNIMRTRDAFETFPCWSADGKRLYYCEARLEALNHLPDSLRQAYVTSHYDSLYYNVMEMDFDERSQTFSKPRVAVDCAASHKSASVPRLSPDGKYLLFTLADYGQFHIWHKTADLWVKDLQRDTTYALRRTNSDDVDSYHTWSSNGRWIVFSSRRDDGNYTRAYLAYFDRQGQGHKAFLLPQEHPMQNILLLKSYNVPELTQNAVRWTAADFREAIYEQKGNTAEFLR